MNNMITLENGILTAKVNPWGAELTSLKLDGMERIWEGDPAIWGRHAPTLFPLVGRLIGQQYELDGEMISAPMHGFCRERAGGLPLPLHAGHHLHVGGKCHLQTAYGDEPFRSAHAL